MTLLAHDAMDLIERAYAAARLEEGDPRNALRRVVAESVRRLVRGSGSCYQPSLDADPEVTRRYAELDRPLIDLVERGRAAGRLRTDFPAWWLVASLQATVYAAWEAITDGRLAPRDAPDLVLTSGWTGRRRDDPRSPQGGRPT